MSIKFLCPFLSQTCFFLHLGVLLLSCMSALRILDTDPLPGVQLTNILSCPTGRLSSSRLSPPRADAL